MGTPNPIPCKYNVSVKKYLSCEHYERCLFIMAEKSYPSFTCEHCKLIDKAREDDILTVTVKSS